MRILIGGLLSFLVLYCGIAWVVEGNDFFLYKVFAPKRAAVERQVFEETKSYNDGMAQELMQMQLDYAKATSTEKRALQSVLLHRVAGYDRSRLSMDLQMFVASVEHDAMVTP